VKHVGLNKEEAKGLKVLRERIENQKTRIPQSVLDESINVATWNIRDFGKSPRLKRSIHYIAEIMNQFDLIALAELRDNLTDLEKVMDVLGPYWKVVFSDYEADWGGNWERMAYVFDKRAVAFTGLAAEAGPPRVKDKKTKEWVAKYGWWRPPYMASFRAGSFDFCVLTCHMRWGDSAAEREKPLRLLAEWVHDRSGAKHVFDRDVIVMGDFNIPSVNHVLYKAITSKGLLMPKALAGVGGSNLSQKNRYDQILHVPMDENVFSVHGGVLDIHKGSYKPLYRGLSKPKTEYKLTFELSDHLPLWIQLNVDDESANLDQLLLGNKMG